MELIEIYESYKEIHEALEKHLESLINEETLKEEQAFKKVLESTQIQIDQMMGDIPENSEGDSDEVNTKDLQYLMADTLFFLMDLTHFLSIGELGRCRMRTINYLSKRRRAQL